MGLWNGECSYPASVKKLKPTKTDADTRSVDMDSSWIELPNNHPDYLNGAVKFIKLAKKNLVEGKIRYPCRRCKEYKHFIFHGKGDVLDHVKYKGSTSREINIDPSNFTSGDDMDGLLKATFGVDIYRCKDDILHDVVDEPLDEGVEPFDIYGDQISSE
ncbi:hypothetical protein Cgig2_018709 [Carnegiea gigantea]|uniref:Transposase-associated domain-containing protein n=1 Tax=Carnegiea gigantea TaxID=171969 RepID=A0A9Q1KFR1_9CARY|nr:hypothetical protein Cgig2_018709 [Carnegiea gigantea]